MNDSNQLVKQRLDQLLNNLNDILYKNWPLLNINGLDGLNRISKRFMHIYEASVIQDVRGSQTDYKYNQTISDINSEFKYLFHILASFKTNLDNLKEILQNMKIIFNMKDFSSFNLLSSDDFEELYAQYQSEYKLKETLINERLFQCRSNNDELLALSAYWMHMPNIDNVLLAKFKYFIKSFQWSCFHSKIFIFLSTFVSSKFKLIQIGFWNLRIFKLKIRIHFYS